MPTLNITTKTNYITKINFQWFIFYKYILNFFLQNLKITSIYHLNIIKALFSINKNFINESKTFIKPIFNRNSDSKFYYKSQKNSTRVLISKPNFINSTNYNLFMLYFQQTTNYSTHFLQPHAYFKHMFISSTLNTSPILNITKLYSKWKNTYNFLTNLFFLKTSMFIFSNKIFKNETLSFNWSRNLLNYNLFKYSSPIFFLNDTRYGVTPTLIFKRFEQKGLEISFLTDIKYHEKNLYYLKRFNIYTIGLVPYNSNPWVVSYSIPISTSSVYIQYFFFKFLSFLSQFAESRLFNDFKKVWLNSL